MNDPFLLYYLKKVILLCESLFSKNLDRWLDVTHLFTVRSVNFCVYETHTAKTRQSFPIFIQ